MTRPREQDRWADLSRLFSYVPLADDAKQTVFELMRSPDRVYHGPSQLAQLWNRHERYAQQAGFGGIRAYRLVACAVAFHDCIYKANRRDNELRSADVWLRLSDGSDLSEADRAWVAETIRATADHLAYGAAASPVDADHEWLESLRLWVLDLDLTPFGASPAEFDHNTDDLRKEFAHLSSQQWEANRLRTLRRLASAPTIYRSPVLAATFEERARHNIKRQLSGDGTLSPA